MSYGVLLLLLLLLLILCSLKLFLLFTLYYAIPRYILYSAIRILYGIWHILIIIFISIITTYSNAIIL